MAKRRSGQAAPAKRAQGKEVLAILHCDEAAAVLDRLLRAHPELHGEAEGIARSLMAETSFEQIAGEVEDALRGIDDEDVYGHAGQKAWGYVGPDEAAVELLEEAIKPFLCDMQRRLSLGEEEEALRIVEGILLGLYRVRGEEGNAALQEARDFADEMASSVYDDWTKAGLERREGRRAKRRTRVLPPEFVHEHLPKWEWLTRRPK